MAAAAWTRHARDVSTEPDARSRYLNVQELSTRIGLAVDTILDTLTRKLEDPTDPRTAILQPVARTGRSRVGADPYWSPEQADEYIRLREARDMRGRSLVRQKLPVYSKADARRAGLAGTAELAEIFDCAENTIRWWARSYAETFPAEVGIAEREGDFMFGPPRGLRKVADVERWIHDDPERVKRIAQARERKLRTDAPSAAS
jgi:hypothetical protein